MIPFITTLTGEPKTGIGGGEGDIYAEVKAAAPEPTDNPPRVEIQPAGTRPRTELPGHVGRQPASAAVHRWHPWSLQTSFYPMSFVDDGAVRLIQASTSPRGP